MVIKRLIDITSTEWTTADSLGRDIQALTVVSLHKIKTSEAIKNICSEVINAVEMSLLVSVNEWTLEARKLKKKTNKPIEYTEYEVNTNGANIRTDWATSRWKDKNPPHGWVYHDTDWALLGTIYETKDERWYALFIEREIANNPHGATLLIKNMKNKLGKLMKKSMQSHP